MKEILGQFLRDLMYVDKTKKTLTEAEKQKIRNDKINEILMVSVLTYAATHEKKAIAKLIEKEMIYLEVSGIKSPPAFSMSIAKKLEEKMSILNISYGIKEDEIKFNNTSENMISNLVKGMIDINSSTEEYDPAHDTLKKHMEQCLNKTSLLMVDNKKFKDKDINEAIKSLYSKTFENWTTKLISYDTFSEIISHGIIPAANICGSAEFFDRFKENLVEKYYQAINNFNFNYNLYSNEELLIYKEKIKKEHEKLNDNKIEEKKQIAMDSLNNEINKILDKLNIKLEYKTRLVPKDIPDELLNNIRTLKIAEQTNLKKHYYKIHGIEYIKGIINIGALLISNNMNTKIDDHLNKVELELKSISYPAIAPKNK